MHLAPMSAPHGWPVTKPFLFLVVPSTLTRTLAFSGTQKNTVNSQK